MPQPALHQLLITSVRYSADEGKRAGFIDGMESPHLLVDVAVGLGADSARDKSRRMLQTVKHDLYHELVRTLSKPCHFHSHL